MMNTLTRYPARADARYPTSLPCKRVKTGMRNPIRREYRVPEKRSGVFDQRKNVKMLSWNSAPFFDLKICFSGHKAVSSLLALGLFLAPSTTHSAFATESDPGNKVTWTGNLRAPIKRPPAPCIVVGLKTGTIGFRDDGAVISTDASDNGQSSQVAVWTNREGLVLKAAKPVLIYDKKFVGVDTKGRKFGTDISEDFFSLAAGFGTSTTSNMEGASATADGRAKLRLPNNAKKKPINVWFQGLYNLPHQVPVGVYFAQSIITCEPE